MDGRSGKAERLRRQVAPSTVQVLIGRVELNSVTRQRSAGGFATLRPQPPRREAGVGSDREGRIVPSNETRHSVVEARFREVTIHRFDRKGQPQTIRLITNLLDVPASVIAYLYRYRWQVELFFRWLKCYAHFDRLLLSHNREAVQAHFHVAVIGILLMYLHTGYRPSKYLFAMMSQVGTGGATLDDILPILMERERQSALARASAKRRAEKKKQSGL